MNDFFTETRLRLWLKTCYEEACRSTDTSTQIGAMFVAHHGTPMTLGNNGFTNGWEPTPEDYERPRKYLVTEHAERNAIYAAARNGYTTEGGVLVSTWAACADCARAIVQSGIRTLVRHLPPSDEATNRWLESVQLGDQIMEAGGVGIINVEGRIPGAPSIIRDGKAFFPDLKLLPNYAY